MSRVLRRVRRDGSSEGGYTLTELIVAMGIFLVVVAVFVTATVTMYKDLRKQTGISDAADQGRKVFSLLDKQVRYADAVNTAGADASGNNWFVEYRVASVNQSTGATVETCTQWKFDVAAKTVGYRNWVSTGAAVSPTPSWKVIAFGVANVLATTKPFTYTAPTATSSFQQLGVDLIISRNKPAGKLETKSTFIALNTSTQTPSALPVCTEVARS